MFRKGGAPHLQILLPDEPTFDSLDAEGPALVVGDEQGDAVAPLAAAEVSQVAGVDAVSGAEVGVCKGRAQTSYYFVFRASNEIHSWLNKTSMGR